MYRLVNNSLDEYQYQIDLHVGVAELRGIEAGEQRDGRTDGSLTHLEEMASSGQGKSEFGLPATMGCHTSEDSDADDFYSRLQGHWIAVGTRDFGALKLLPQRGS